MYSPNVEESAKADTSILALCTPAQLSCMARPSWQQSVGVVYMHILFLVGVLMRS